MSLLAVKTMPVSATACYCSRSRSSQTLVWRSTLKDGTKTDQRSAGGRWHCVVGSLAVRFTTLRLSLIRVSVEL